MTEQTKQENHEGSKQRDNWVPGECHAHLFLNGLSYPEAKRTHRNGPDKTVIYKELLAYKERGVLFVRDGGDPCGVSSAAREIANSLGINYRTPIFAIHKTGHYGGIVGKAFSTMKEYTDLVREVKAEKGDFIKIMTSGIMDFQTRQGLSEDGLDRDEVREMVSIAHDFGFRVMSHTNGAQAVIDAVEAGVDSLEHGNFQNEESLCALSESQTVWVPTTVTIRNLIHCGRFSDSVLRMIWEDLVANLHTARKLHIHMALGSDAGAFCVQHGQGILDEYRTFRNLFPEDVALIDDLQDGECRIHSFSRDGQ